MKDEALMKRFAAEQLRKPGQDFEICMAIFSNGPLAFAAIDLWNADPVVLTERLRLQQEYGERAELPSKETVMLEILALGRDSKLAVRDRLNAYNLYSEMNNYTGRNSGAALAPVNLFANKVMMVTDHGTDEEWEKAAAEQQETLVRTARENAQRNATTH